MMDPHLILISGGLQPIRVSEVDYKKHIVASDSALVLLDSEELFAAVVSCYAELELVVFELSLKNMLGEDAFAQGLGEIRVETFSGLCWALLHKSAEGFIS